MHGPPGQIRIDGSARPKTCFPPFQSRGRNGGEKITAG